MGLVCACVYVCLLIVFIPFPFSAAISSDPLVAAVNPEYSAHRQVRGVSSCIGVQLTEGIPSLPYT